MTNGFRILSATLAVGLAMAGAPQAQTNEASELSAEELNQLFETQKTRGLVIAPTDETTSVTTTAQDSNGQTTTVTTITPNDGSEGSQPSVSTYAALAPEEQVNIQISFDFDSAALREDQKPKLATLCSVMKDSDVSKFQIVGHTDSKGADSYNQSLSLLRAEEVKRHLVGDCGMKPERLEAVGVGEEYPIDTTNPESEENRRVEFQALG
ncbi:OmpA family protein [Qingshengfaniella alkalisoli]|uniref:OmpA family protein n=1 Tax=Qingshengfaniella alkalisoli TaxID=2599296 RepID=A0A5B8IXM2_9RHOB|nr:OmpA family protein [Qingshengfaniella alkalisoli]QDY70912.1 OmpA family protein [Qingshengfaniella alkalisoli]